MKLKEILLTENAIKIDVPEDTSYEDFAVAVAEYLKEQYGSHNYKGFVKKLLSELDIKPE